MASRFSSVRSSWSSSSVSRRPLLGWLPPVTEHFDQSCSRKRWVRLALLAAIVFVIALFAVDGSMFLKSTVDPELFRSRPAGMEKQSNVGKKALISAALKADDTRWQHDFFPEWQKITYRMDDSSAKYATVNRGREASAYLTYIINHYDNLPDFMVFIHAERYQWHNDDPMYDGVPPLQNLKLDYVQSEGYANLRCTWDPGCPTFIKPNISHVDGPFDLVGTFALAWQELFPGQEIPEAVGGHCCAQFAVTRQQVRNRPAEDYHRYRHWLWNNDLSDVKSGTMLEHYWHVIFGKEVIHCPDVKQCFCNLYGLCDLACPIEGKCRGRWLPPKPLTALPHNWPDKSVQGDGWPVEGWWLSSDGSGNE